MRAAFRPLARRFESRDYGLRRCAFARRFAGAKQPMLLGIELDVTGVADDMAAMVRNLTPRSVDHERHFDPRHVGETQIGALPTIRSGSKDAQEPSPLFACQRYRMWPECGCDRIRRVELRRCRNRRR